MLVEQALERSPIFDGDAKAALRSTGARIGRHARPCRCDRVTRIPPSDPGSTRVSCCHAHRTCEKKRKGVPAR